MAFVTTATEEPSVSDVSAGAFGEARVEEAPSPTNPPAAAGSSLEAATRAGVPGVVEAAADDAEEVAGTDEAAAVVDADAIVPEDFVPVFVSDDLTDTGAHTSATTPVPLTPAPRAPAAVQEPSDSKGPAASPPSVDRPSTPTPTPVPPTPTPVDQGEPDAPPGRGDGPTAAEWEALRQCESGGNYGIDTGNGYYGAYQFSQSTWDWVASLVRADLVGVVPSKAAPGDQDALAFALYDMQGAAPWPTCGAHLR